MAPSSQARPTGPRHGVSSATRRNGHELVRKVRGISSRTPCGRVGPSTRNILRNRFGESVDQDLGLDRRGPRKLILSEALTYVPRRLGARPERLGPALQVAGSRPCATSPTPTSSGCCHRRSEPSGSPARRSWPWPTAAPTCRPSRPCTPVAPPSRTPCPRHTRHETCWAASGSASFPTTQTRGLPAVTGLMVVNDGDTGEPRCVMAAGALTAARTAAVSGACIAALSAPGATAAIVGAGVQARSHLRVLAALGHRRSRSGPAAAEARAGADRLGRQPPSPRCELAVSDDLGGTRCADADVVVTGLRDRADRRRPWTRSWLRPDVLLLPLDYASSVGADLARSAMLATDHVAQFEAVRRSGIAGRLPRDHAGHRVPARPATPRRPDRLPEPRQRPQRPGRRRCRGRRPPRAQDAGQLLDTSARVGSSR